MEKMFNQLLQQMKELTEQLQYQSAQLQQQNEQLAELQEIIAAKDAQIAALTRRIEELTHKKNSGNSSKPPSSERLNKPAPKSLRVKSGKSAGGQPGHKGSGMKIDREPNEVIEHRPIQCEGCPHAGVCKLRCCETRYEYEAIVETKLIAHKVLGCKVCALTGEAAQGIFPQHITGAKQYGPGVAGLAVSLLTIGYMSVDRVQKLLRSLRIPVSSGAIQDMLTKAARLVEAPVERIRQTVTQLPVAHYDETGWRVAGKLHWLHCACNEQWRYYTVQEKRGQEGITDMGVLPNASGVAVHDFWMPYKKYANVDTPAAWQCMTSGSPTRSTTTSITPCAVRTWSENWSTPMRPATRPGPNCCRSCCKRYVTAARCFNPKGKKPFRSRNWQYTSNATTNWSTRGLPPTPFRNALPENAGAGQRANSGACWSASATSRMTS